MTSIAVAAMVCSRGESLTHHISQMKSPVRLLSICVAASVFHIAPINAMEVVIKEDISNQSYCKKLIKNAIRYTKTPDIMDRGIAINYMFDAVYETRCADTPLGWLLMSAIYFEGQRTPNAIWAAGQSINLDPSYRDGEAYAKRAQYYYWMGDNESACSDLAEARKYDARWRVAEYQYRDGLNCNKTTEAESGNSQVIIAESPGSADVQHL